MAAVSSSMWATFYNDQEEVVEEEETSAGESMMTADYD